MDSAILPGQPLRTKKYRHFTIETDPEAAASAVGKKEFFYIGRSTAKIDFLVQTFTGGYAAENPEKAISILNRIADGSVIPDVIIVDHILGEPAIQELSRFVTDSSVYSRVPFVLDAGGLDSNDLEKFRQLRVLDEIVFLGHMDKENLLSKIAFLKNVKASFSGFSGLEPYRQPVPGYLEPGTLLKRLFDIMVSALLIILLSPVLLLIAIAIKLESRGPVLYVSKRAGKGYRIFNMYKFRTMVVDADKNMHQLSHLNHYNNDGEKGQVFFKVMNDSRITRVGAFLRNLSIDELPQFFNVLVGSMSLVGNRPLPLYEAVKLTTNNWAERFMAPAGITGLWQIKKRKQPGMTMEARLDLDITYSRKHNFMYDLWIMANTPSALLQKSNA